ncbi:hypothetical protein CYMTET_10283 [Cymbomonas tetramitiformis]|uniref:Uncharacterized protein n=1 Tax=Cymbomonas tetramitiformis TaxID=36881 RepID=A0AAE0LE01_9CHLO|nr:hypothetical protein CYMTET_10283 [Cymbomonas tetramitiformis]
MCVVLFQVGEQTAELEKLRCAVGAQAVELEWLWPVQWAHRLSWSGCCRSGQHRPLSWAAEPLVKPPWCGIYQAAELEWSWLWCSGRTGRRAGVAGWSVGAQAAELEWLRLCAFGAQAAELEWLRLGRTHAAELEWLRVFAVGAQAAELEWLRL